MKGHKEENEQFCLHAGSTVTDELRRRETGMEEGKGLPHTTESGRSSQS